MKYSADYETIIILVYDCDINYNDHMIKYIYKITFLHA